MPCTITCVSSGADVRMLLSFRFLSFPDFFHILRTNIGDAERRQDAARQDAEKSRCGSHQAALFVPCLFFLHFFPFPDSFAVRPQIKVLQLVAGRWIKHVRLMRELLLPMMLLMHQCKMSAVHPKHHPGTRHPH